MICATIRYSLTLSPAPGSTTMIQRYNRIDYGPSVPPGRYTQIDLQGMHQSCIYADGNQLGVAGRVGDYDVSATWTTAT